MIAYGPSDKTVWRPPDIGNEVVTAQSFVEDENQYGESFDSKLLQCLKCSKAFEQEENDLIVICSDPISYSCNTTQTFSSEEKLNWLNGQFQMAVSDVHLQHPQMIF